MIKPKMSRLELRRLSPSIKVKKLLMVSNLINRKASHSQRCCGNISLKCCKINKWIILAMLRRGNHFRLHNNHNFHSPYHQCNNQFNKNNKFKVSRTLPHHLLKQELLSKLTKNNFRLVKMNSEKAWLETNLNSVNNYHLIKPLPRINHYFNHLTHLN